MRLTTTPMCDKMVSMNDRCIGPECTREAVVKGLCQAHNKQLWRGQELRVLGSKKGGHTPRPIEDRFWEKVEITENCWIWTGAITSSGHGNISSLAAHRVAYELEYGTIPEGLDVDHECHNIAANLGLCNGGVSCPHRRCVRPDHLVAKTRGDNLRASPFVGYHGKAG